MLAPSYPHPPELKKTSPLVQLPFFPEDGNQHSLPWYVGWHLAMAMAINIVCH